MMGAALFLAVSLLRVAYMQDCRLKAVWLVQSYLAGCEVWSHHVHHNSITHMSFREAEASCGQL